MIDLADRLRTWLSETQTLRAEYAERAESPTDGHSAHCARSARREADPPNIVYTGRELGLLTGASPAMRESIDKIKSTFSDLGGATLIDVRPDPTWPPRRHAARAIRQARRSGDKDRATALRDGWHERVAVCVVDGGLRLEDAERVAVGEVCS